MRSALMICDISRWGAIHIVAGGSRTSSKRVSRSRCLQEIAGQNSVLSCPAPLVTQLGPRVSHSRNCAGPAWTCGTSCGTARAASGTGAKTRIRRGARARTRYAGARSLLTSHGPGCPRMTLGTGCLLRQGRSARSCDQACNQQNVFQWHVITKSGRYTRCLHPS